MEEEGSSVADSDVLSLYPNTRDRDTGMSGARQETVFTEQEPPQSPRTALKDPRVNLRFGTGSLQVIVDHTADTAPKVPP